MDTNKDSVDFAYLFRSKNKYARFFEYAEGRHAMVYIPHAPVLPKVGLFLFNAGHRYRTGPHDIYVKLGVALSERGLYVITADPEGLGDGFSKFKFQHTQQHQNKIQKELYVADSITCLKFFKQELSLSRVVASGLCGGTRTAISCANKWDGLDRIIAWSCPFQLSGNVRIGYSKESGDSVRQLENTGCSNEIQSLKVDRTSKLLKFVLLQIDWSYHLTRLKRSIYQICNKDMSFDYKAEKLLKKLFNRDFPIIFIYSENDLHYDVYKNYYLSWFGKKYYVDNITTVLKNTNHVVGDRVSQKKLCDIMYEFCTKKYDLRR